jgi:hypothetical protein
VNLQDELHRHWHSPSNAQTEHGLTVPRPFHHTHPFTSPHGDKEEGWLVSLINLAHLKHCLRANPERAIVLHWIIEEWYHYSNAKWNFEAHGNRSADDHEEWMREKGFQRDSEWRRQILQYFDRCDIFTVGEHGLIDERSSTANRGRQAAMKTGTTLIDALACMIRNFGLPPAPGQTSGDIEEWSVNMDLLRPTGDEAASPSGEGSDPADTAPVTAGEEA